MKENEQMNSFYMSDIIISYTCLLLLTGRNAVDGMEEASIFRKVRNTNPLFFLLNLTIFKFNC
jgi:hypothetical protein